MDKEKGFLIMDDEVTMIDVIYNGKTKRMEQVVPGVVKYGEAYLVKCSITDEWFYCNEERFNKKVAIFGSETAVGTNYLSRKGKKIQDANS